MDERDADRTDEELLAAAREAAADAYAPYSAYAVGAALETVDGAVYTGCNVENANFSNSLHAEEVAVGAAVADGHREFARLAVSSAARDGVTPCGMCRQTLAEFCDAEFPVLVEGRDAEGDASDVESDASDVEGDEGDAGGGTRETPREARRTSNRPSTASTTSSRTPSRRRWSSTGSRREATCTRRGNRRT